jgi:hypothetical protein
MNFKWNPQNATLLLSVPQPTIDPRVILYAQEHGYKQKLETHITLISFQNAKKILEVLQQHVEKAFELAQSYEWKFEYTADYSVLERTINAFVLNGQVQTPAHIRRSIIQSVKAPDMVDFFAKLSVMVGSQLPIPISHVTLFSWSDYEPEMLSGIAVNSEEDFRKYLKEAL